MLNFGFILFGFVILLFVVFCVNFIGGKIVLIVGFIGGYIVNKFVGVL